MKILVIYYSRTGITKKVAEILKDKLGADIEAINSDVDYKGAIGYLRAGRESTLKIIPGILPLKSQLENYDLVVIGTPVWAFTMASPIMAFMKKYSVEARRAAFFCTQGGSGAKRTFKQMAELLGQAPSAKLILNTKEVILDRISEKVDNFIVQIKNSLI